MLVSSVSVKSVSKVHSATLRDHGSILTYILCCGFMFLSPGKIAEKNRKKNAGKNNMA